MMTARVLATVATVAITMIATGCDRADTANTAVTSTSPAGTSAAPSSNSARHRDEALLRVVQAAPSGTNVDLFAGDLLLFDGLAFKAVTPYRAVDGQRYAFALRPAGMVRADPLSSNTEDLNDGDYYTAFAMPGDGSGPTLRIVSDHLDRPASNKARVRVVHAGVNAGKIDLRAAGTTEPLFDDVEYQAVTDYREVTPLSGAIEIAAEDRNAPLLAGINAHLEAGRFYTIVVLGNARSTPRLEAFLIEDALTP
jgi:hypothetical protein